MDWRGARVLAVAVAAVTISTFTPHLARAPDPAVAAIASEVSFDQVRDDIQTLQDFVTRYSYTPQCSQAADWLYGTLQGYGIEVEFQEFDVGGQTLRNVVGRLVGTVDPDRVFIIGAHYDSTSETPWTHAPGADDNASGVAAVLEAARIFSNYRFRSTVEFIAFGGEEQGRRGSIHDAQQAALAGKNIVGMINLDMIGYWPASSDQELDIGKNAASSWLALAAEEAATTYASIPVHNWPNTGVCYDDHVSYWDRGYDAIVLMDCYEAHLDPVGSGESTPHYHRTTDTIATLDLAQTTEAVRAAVAAMALLAEPLVSAVDLRVDKLPAVGDVHLSWTGGLPPYVVECSTARDFSSGVVELTPPGGTMQREWVHAGALDDEPDYYYRVGGP